MTSGKITHARTHTNIRGLICLCTKLFPVVFSILEMLGQWSEKNIDESLKENLTVYLERNELAN